MRNLKAPGIGMLVVLAGIGVLQNTKNVAIEENPTPDGGRG